MPTISLDEIRDLRHTVVLQPLGDALLYWRVRLLDPADCRRVPYLLQQLIASASPPAPADDELAALEAAAAQGGKSDEEMLAEQLRQAQEVAMDVVVGISREPLEVDSKEWQSCRLVPSSAQEREEDGTLHLSVGTLDRISAQAIATAATARLEGAAAVARRFLLLRGGRDGGPAGSPGQVLRKDAG